MGIDEKVVEQKIAAGEELTKEEQEFVMGYPNVEEGDAVEDETAEGEETYEEIEEETKGEKKEEEEKTEEEKAKEAADAKKKAEDQAAEEAKAAEAKKAEDAKKAEKAGGKSLKDKVEEEMAKPDSQVDLEGFSEKEVGLFWEMRAERKKRQAAQEELDGMKFQRIKEQKAQEEAAKVKKAEEEGKGELDKLLEGDDDDFISKKDLKKVLEKITAKPKADGSGDRAELEARQRRAFVEVAEAGARERVAIRKEKGEFAPDYFEVMALADEIVTSNKEYEETILGAVKAKKNPALVTYDIIIKDPRFKTLFKGDIGKKTEETAEKKAELTERAKKVGLAETATEKEIIAKEEALKKAGKFVENANKPKTSGSEGGGGGGSTFKDSEGKEYSLMELSKMSTSQFRKVSKDVRDWFLKGF